MALIRKFADQLFSAVLRPEGTAGACVPEHGTYCGCTNHRKVYVNCNGICTATAQTC